MFETLFHHPRVLARHADAPLADERSTFLSQLVSRGTPRSTLLRHARQLRVIATMLKRKLPGQILRKDIARCARRWAQQQLQRGRSKSLKCSIEHFVQVACAWSAFMGWLAEEPESTPAHASKLAAWVSMLGSEDELSERTISGYRWWTDMFLRWLSQQAVPLHQLSLFETDEFMNHLRSRELSRVTLATAATALRRFLDYAYAQGWCRRDLSQAILSPPLFRQENLPAGPAWSDVRRLIATTNGTTPQDLRNRVILLLLAVYGLRSGEVRSLRLADVDWPRRILRVKRSKTARVQEYPLTTATARALRCYLKSARPESTCAEVFLTLRAPFRPLSSGAVHNLTCSLMERLNIASPKRGPHALRHACATYLLNQGLSLKGVGDHLGHRSLSATQIYAKVDLEGLRTVAAFDLGGLI